MSVSGDNLPRKYQRSEFAVLKDKGSLRIFFVEYVGHLNCSLVTLCVR